LCSKVMYLLNLDYAKELKLEHAKVETIITEADLPRLIPS